MPKGGSSTNEREFQQKTHDTNGSVYDSFYVITICKSTLYVTRLQMKSMRLTSSVKKWLQLTNIATDSGTVFNIHFMFFNIIYMDTWFGYMAILHSCLGYGLKAHLQMKCICSGVTLWRHLSLLGRFSVQRCRGKHCYWCVEGLEILIIFVLLSWWHICVGVTGQALRTSVPIGVPKKRRKPKRNANTSLCLPNLS